MAAPVLSAVSAWGLASWVHDSCWHAFCRAIGAQYCIVWLVNAHVRSARHE